MGDIHNGDESNPPTTSGGDSVEQPPVAITGVRSVAIIGAGVSSILATRYLREAGLEVTVFERNSRAGGVWIYDERTPADPVFPAQDPLKTAIQMCPWHQDEVRPPEILNATQHADWISSHAPTSPCYAGLTNNFSVLAMEIKDHPWSWEIPIVTPESPDHESEWVNHECVLDHLTTAASKFGLEEKVHYRTLVEKVQKTGDKWTIRTSTLTPLDDEESYRVSSREWEFDAVVVASGHYNTPRVPDIPGLARWREKYPDLVQHSKGYRHPEGFKDQNVLLIGGGTSSTEIARELGPFAKQIYQSGRGSPFDLPLDMLPDNCKRMCEIAEFGETTPSANLGSGSGSQPIPDPVTLSDGTVLHDIHRVVVCTGYHYAYPFLKDFHAQTPESVPGRPKPLVTDGTCTLNLHQDMFYIPDPTLAFAGTSLFISTFAFFEYQAMFIAAVFSGNASLPSRTEMETLYAERFKARGSTRFMNARMDEEVSYVDRLVALLNASDPRRRIQSFSQQWHAVREAGKLQKIRLRFAREKAQQEQRQAMSTSPD